MTLFEHPLWPYVKPFGWVVEGRDNLDFLQLPEQLRTLALEAVVNCVACGAIVHPLRVRAQSERSRVAGTPTERRLFYAPTCPTETNPGCSRTKAASQHKNVMRMKFGQTSR